MAKFIFRSSDIAMFVALTVYFLLDFPPGSLMSRLSDLGLWPVQEGAMSDIPALPQIVQVAFLSVLLAISLYGHLGEKTSSRAEH
ncbi:hypothetical protein [Peteryoungia ipomoeae]|uniref:Uncharacterized protein n=1 Tax=Peteryoungia ipomoeae TaxID=1210932 RepID=A0A4S8P5J9_9HYPH|nr:hypothetical protein [Peteryoungia ipomoeae]THV25428.1 hypothetical protein FAA97_04335 [Peteryoungia ipomoeae]